MLVRHFMTRSVFSVRSDADCGSVVALFRERGIRHAPVLQDSQLVGMVSESDLLRALLPSGKREGANGSATPVSSVMATEVLALDPLQNLEDAARTLLTYKISGLPVIEQGVLVGFLTESDLFRGLMGLAVSELELRITFEAPKGAKDLPDPVLVVMNAGFQVRAFLSPENVDGSKLYMMRLVGGRRDALLQGLSKAGYNLVELRDARAAA
jgi:acetoin utilization protein AcuB